MKNANERIEIKEKDYELLIAAPYFISLLKRVNPFVLAFAIGGEKTTEDNIKFRKLAGALSNKIREVGEYWEQNGLSFFPKKDDVLDGIQIKISDSDFITIPIAKNEKWEETAIKEWNKEIYDDWRFEAIKYLIRFFRIIKKFTNDNTWEQNQM